MAISCRASHCLCAALSADSDRGKITCPSWWRGGVLTWRRQPDTLRHRIVYGRWNSILIHFYLGHMLYCEF